MLTTFAQVCFQSLVPQQVVIMNRLYRKRLEQRQNINDLWSWN